MPLFEYECRDCHALTEVLVGVGAEAEAAPRCERCGGGDLAKKLSRINIGRSQAYATAPCGEAACPPGGGCCGGHCQGHNV